MSRFVSLLGYAAPVAVTLDTRRLRATLGLKLLYWIVLLALVLTTAAMRAPLIGIETLIVFVVLYPALRATFYEICYDRDRISLPRWWFGRTTCRWCDLEALTERQGWFLVFHFRGGKVLQAHKYVVGYAGLREKAEAALREV